MASDVYRAGQPVLLRFTLQSISSITLYILDWHTPLEGLRGRIFRVARNGADVPYRGLLAKRGSPTREEYLEVHPEGLLVAEIDLSTSYDLSQPGRYGVQFVARLVDVVSDESELPRDLAHHRQVDIDCNGVSFMIVDDTS
ncbi:MAG: hypothetical protein IIA54_04580 [Chloroflexi bacterium]|nr:hypothetical protein [Chloroflexota bacterium]